MKDISTFAGPGRRASEGSLGRLARCPEPGTSGQRRLGNWQGLDRQQERIQWEVIEDEVQEGNWSLEAGWDRPRARCHHLRRAVALLQLCAGCLLPSCAASTLFGFL